MSLSPVTAPSPYGYGFRTAAQQVGNQRDFTEAVTAIPEENRSAIIRGAVRAVRPGANGVVPDGVVLNVLV